MPITVDLMNECVYNNKMIYEITLATPDGTEVTDRVDLPLDPELSWREFCEHREFLHWKKYREDWPVIDITPEDLIRVVEPEPEEDAEPEEELVRVLDIPVAAPVIDSAKPKPKKPKFIDSWSGRTSKNPVFTEWMAKAVKNGISPLTFKSRVYKLGYDYQRAATQPIGQQGYKQRLAKLNVDNS